MTEGALPFIMQEMFKIPLPFVVYIASHNLHKIEEIQQIVSTQSFTKELLAQVMALGYVCDGDALYRRSTTEAEPPLQAPTSFFSFRSIGEVVPYQAPEENGTTYLENAKIKAEYAYHLGKGEVDVLADDSGLEVAALGGFPGIHSARFAPEEEQIPQLLEKMKDVTDPKDRGLCFHCAVAFAGHDGMGKPWEFGLEREVSGQMLTGPQGSKGFGYDPIFYLPSLEKSFAQVPTDIKNQYSHRGKAVRAFCLAYLEGKLGHVAR